jgi:hypothetical protein
MSTNGHWYTGSVMTLALAGWLAADSACQAQSLRPATSGTQQKNGSGSNSSSSGNTGSSSTGSPKIVARPKNTNVVDPPNYYTYGSGYTPPLYPYGNSYNSNANNNINNTTTGGNGPIKTYTGFGRISYAVGPYNYTVVGKDPTNPNAPPIPGPSPYTMNNYGPYAPPYTTYPYTPYNTPYNPYTTPYTPYSPYTTPYNPYVSPYNTPYNPYVSPYTTPYNPYIQPNAAPYNYQMSLLLQQQAQQQMLLNYSNIDLTNRALQGYRQSVLPLGDGFGGTVSPGAGYRTPGY